MNENEGPRLAVYFYLPDFCDGHEQEIHILFGPMLAIDKLIRPKTWEER